MRLLTRAIPFVIAAFWILSSGALLALDITPPTLTSLTFNPNTINVASGSHDVTVTFAATDDSSGVFYVEVGFVDPTNSVFQRGCASAAVIPGCGSFTGGTSVTSTLTVTFPQFSPQGAWTVAYALVFDANFNLTFLGPLGLGPLPNDPGTLQVNSVADTTPPIMTAFSFNSSIDATAIAAAARTVTMNFTLTDNISGAANWQIGFTSPSGASTQSTTVPVSTACTTSGAQPTSTCTASIVFPQFSQAGTWTITSCIMADAVGNTTVWDTLKMQCKLPDGTTDTSCTHPVFPTTLSVTSTPDTTPPNLTAFSLSPSTITAAGGPVTVNFTLTDDISGANAIQVSFVSPSGVQIVSGTTNFPGATSVASALVVNFPLGTEVGTWTMASVFISDVAGNTRLISQPISLTVNTPPADTTPPVIIPNVSPLPNGAWNNSTPVTVTWTVFDPETGIASSTGCGTTTITTPTTGTPVTCMATNGASLTNTVTVTVKIDVVAPVTSNVNATPNPLAVGADLTITATVTDTGGSGVASAEYQVDGGPFDDLVAIDGTFDSSNEGVTLTLPGTNQLLVQPGVHTICIRGTDVAGNIGATECIIVAVHGLNSFTSGGGGTNSPAGADLQNPAGTGPVTFGFNVKQLPGDTVPSGDLEFHYKVGNLDFKGSSFDFQVVSNGNHSQIQGTGTVNGTSVCKFMIDAWDNSFAPNNVDAFGLRIFNCDGGTTDRYNLTATPLTKGNIVIHP